MTHLFAYGTLMCGDIFLEVTGCSLDHETATLKGYSRRRVKGETYPALLPDAAAQVEGILYFDVPDPVWIRMDRFEGSMYERRSVEVWVEDGRMVRADTYVVHPDAVGSLEAREWDFAEFLRQGKSAFQRQYKGFRST